VTRRRRQLERLRNADARSAPSQWLASVGFGQIKRNPISTKDAQMKAVVYHGVGDIRLDDVADPKIRSRLTPWCGSLRRPSAERISAYGTFDERADGWLKVALAL
jgi:hypothetical protein